MPAATARRLAWSNTAPLGTPGRPAGPHDGDRVVRVERSTEPGASRCRPSWSRAAASEPRVSTVPDPGGTDSSATTSVSTTVTTGWTRAMIEACSAAPMRRFTPVVMAPMPGRGLVAHGVVDRRRQKQTDDVALGHPHRGEQPRHRLARRRPTPRSSDAGARRGRRAPARSHRGRPSRHRPRPRRSRRRRPAGRR